jgi:hypothetical protein
LLDSGHGLFPLPLFLKWRERHSDKPGNRFGQIEGRGRKIWKRPRKKVDSGGRSLFPFTEKGTLLFFGFVRKVRVQSIFRDYR